MPKCLVDNVVLGSCLILGLPDHEITKFLAVHEPIGKLELLFGSTDSLTGCVIRTVDHSDFHGVKRGKLSEGGLEAVCARERGF